MASHSWLANHLIRRGGEGRFGVYGVMLYAINVISLLVLKAVNIYFADLRQGGMPQLSALDPAPRNHVAISLSILIETYLLCQCGFVASYVMSFLVRCDFT